MVRRGMKANARMFVLDDEILPAASGENLDLGKLLVNLKVHVIRGAIVSWTLHSHNPEVRLPTSIVPRVTEISTIFNLVVATFPFLLLYILC